MLDISTTKRQIIKYLAISAFFLLFGLIYEHFSHHIYSNYMIYAFLFPLIMGTLVYGLIYRTKINDSLSALGMNIYNASIITLTLGSTVEGILEIYGTTNKLVTYYLIVGTALLIISLLVNIINTIKDLKS